MIKELIDFLKITLAALEQNHEWHQAYDDHGDYPGSAIEATNIEAISAIKSALADI